MNQSAALQMLNHAKAFSLGCTTLCSEQISCSADEVCNIKRAKNVYALVLASESSLYEVNFGVHQHLGDSDHCR